MCATSPEVGIEFGVIAGEIAHLGAALERLHAASPDRGSQEAWEAARICASAAEKIYTGLERVMARIVAEIDAALIGHGEGWHRALLGRIAHTVPGRRPAVISQVCYDRLRAFRHRERNTYGLDLYLGIVLERSAEAIAAFDLFRRVVRCFFAMRGSEAGPAVCFGPS